MTLPYESYQFTRVGEASGYRAKARFTSGRIAAQGQDIADTGGGQALDHRANFVPRRAHACKMGHRFDASVPPDPRHDLKRLLPRGPARSVRNRYEGGIERA